MWYSHEKMYKLLNFTFEIKTESPLRIGAGRNVAKLSLVDLPVILMKINEKDLPYIPGSSLKGVFRNASEFLARSYGLNACFMGEGCKKEYDEKLQNSMKEGDVEKIRNVLSNYCLICKIYGTATFSSHIKFGDAYPPEGHFPSRVVKTGIAIDRKSGAAKTGALYQVEFLNPGSIFIQTTSFFNVPNYGIGLFSEIVDNVNSGFIRVGGFKSRGFGKVSMNLKKLEGFVMVNGEYISIESSKVLPPADDQDEEVEIKGLDEGNLIQLMGKFKEVWRKYVRKIRSGG